MDDCCRTSLEPLVREMEQNNESILLPFAGNDVMIATTANAFLCYAIHHLPCSPLRYFTPYLTVSKSSGTLYLNGRRVEYQRMHPNFHFRFLGGFEGKIRVHVFTNFYTYLSIVTAASWMTVLLRNKRTRPWRRTLSHTNVLSKYFFRKLYSF